MTFFIAYLATAIVFLFIDFIWLGYVASGFYKAQLGGLMADPVNLKIAAGFYLIYAIGIAYFAVLPALDQDKLVLALVNGAIFGFMAYATYDMTNMATIKDWPIKMSLLDMAWGTVLTAVSAVAGAWLTKMALNMLS